MSPFSRDLDGATTEYPVAHVENGRVTSRIVRSCDEPSDIVAPAPAQGHDDVIVLEDLDIAVASRLKASDRHILIHEDASEIMEERED